MKFGKSYMETLASPSFPKEWREGAIEYKQLKKLINGVVAELESLGLGAEVLRDLMVPHGEETEDSDEEDTSADVADPAEEAIEQLDELDLDDVDGTQSSTDHRYTHHHLHGGPALRRPDIHSRPSSAGMTTSSSADDCDECAKDLQRHKEENSHSDSPAADWVAHIAHAKHSSKRHRRRSTRKSSNALPDGARPATAPWIETLNPPFSSSYDPSTVHSDGFAGMGGSSDDASGLHPSARMGKKDLEAYRRRNSSVDGFYRPSNVSTLTGSSKDRVHDWGGHAWRERQGLRPSQPAAPKREPSPHKHKVKWVQGKDGRRARAEYELGGTSEKPVPRIRLFVESPVQSDDEVEAKAGDEADSEGGPEDEVEDESSEVEVDDDDDGRITELQTTPRNSIGAVKPLQGHPRSPNFVYGDGAHSKKRMRRREIVIPLNADTEFLDTLTGALSNLTALQESQREQFQHSTEAVCKAVSQVASPYGNKNDLYAWREIFALWCEMQIFESQREKDRGELSVDETEARLKHFAEELAKRGWDTEALTMDASHPNAKKHHKLGKWKGFGHSGGLPMKDPKSVAALEDFLKLNLALLDVKKFQRVNIEAARKILKKHDKRTALTASSDLSAFVQHQESMRATTASAAAGVGISSLVNVPEHSIASNHGIVSTHGTATHPSLAALLPSSTSALMSASLPHILLTLMTSTLLPILPSIDDYSCAICTSVAWRPIKLDCGHLFCIRCLVKLQKQGKEDCPLCRAKGVVGSADERNMDPNTVKFLKEWFPKEIAEKTKENEKDRHKEEMLELGFALENEKCIVM